MSIKRFYFTYFILFFCPILLNCIQFPYSRSKECTNPILHMDNGGLIQSHRYFGITSYPNKMDCLWVILAPSNYQIMIQFNFLNIESNILCSYDYLEFITMKNFSTKICGNDDSKRYISMENQLFVRFHSDGSIMYEGFQMRYLFVESKYASTVNLLKINFPCAFNEWKCTFVNTCIPKNWKCDNIRDCRDNSDETDCFFSRSCHQSQENCMNGACIPTEFVCNGIGDCEDNSDESFCNLNTSINPFKPSLKNQCSYQSIRPKQLDNSIVHPQIVGGSEATPGSWPWMISLKYGPSHMCGGSLITNDFVLTAAHCFTMNSNPDSYSVDFGRHFLYSGLVENIGVEKIIVHPSYTTYTNGSDIALIKLKRKVKFTASIQTVCIPEHLEEPKAGKKCVILGWGNTRGTGGEGVLKQAVVPIVDRTVCNQFYTHITDQMICAGYQAGGVDSCQGDSGGPILCEYNNKFVLYGIVSFGYKCASPNSPGIYTNIVKFVDWINKSIENSVSLQTTKQINFFPSTQSPYIRSQTTNRNKVQDLLSTNPGTRVNNNFDISKYSNLSITNQQTTKIKNFKTTTTNPKKFNSATTTKITNKVDSYLLTLSLITSKPISSLINTHSSTSFERRTSGKNHLISIVTKSPKESKHFPYTLKFGSLDSKMPTAHPTSGIHETQIRRDINNPTKETPHFPSITKRLTNLYFTSNLKYINTIQIQGASDQANTINSTINPLLNGMTRNFRNPQATSRITNNFTNFNESVLDKIRI